MEAALLEVHGCLDCWVCNADQPTRTPHESWTPPKGFRFCVDSETLRVEPPAQTAARFEVLEVCAFRFFHLYSA